MTKIIFSCQGKLSKAFEKIEEKINQLEKEGFSPVDSVKALIDKDDNYYAYITMRK